jgi:glycosyltransferase involved in cell wall biosynthesis
MDRATISAQPTSTRISGPQSPTPRDTRVTFWTGWLSPEMEGTSKEVFALQKHFPRSLVMGLSQHYWAKLSLRGRYAGVHVRAYPLLWLLRPMLERRTEIHHLYGTLGEWFFLRLLRRRPIVLTVAVPGEPLAPEYYRHVRAFVTHSELARENLLRWGLHPRQVRVLYPGIDLTSRIPPRSPEDRRFRLLFATSPTDVQGFRTRGVGLVLDAAARLPEVEFHLVWRPWGESASNLRQRLAARHLNNVHLHFGLVADMREHYGNADATIVPFLEATDMKLCPTTLVESLAYGRPVVVTTPVGIADLVQEERCGEVAEPTVEGVCNAIERLRSHYVVLANNARPCAERHFALPEVLRQHEELYREVLTSPA